MLVVLSIKENITALNQWPSRSGHKPLSILIHSTWGSYKGSVSWFHNPSSGASCHYIIDVSGEITMCVVEAAAAWHGGVITVAKEESPKVVNDNWGTNFNLISIGIEMTDNREKKHIYPKIQYSSAIELVADICRRYDIKPTRDYILMHKEIDPINRSDPVGEWDQNDFVKEVQSCLLEGGVEYKIQGKPDKVKVTCSLNVRSGPATTFRLSGCRILNKGDKVDVVGYVSGEEVEGNKFWYKSTLGNYFWSGGTDKPILSVVELIGNMTKEEYEVKKAELTSKEAAIEARRLELENAVEMNRKDKEAYELDLNALLALTAESIDEPVVETPAEVVVEPVVEDEPVAEVVVETPVEPVVEAKPELTEEELGWFKKIAAKLGL